MNQTEQSKKAGNTKQIIAFIIGILVVYFVVTFLTNQKLSALQQETRVLIAEQEKFLATIAEITARNGADDITERIVRDCSNAERTEFDQLLGNLNNGLNRTQLVELERLFGRCGSFFAERKAVMAARFQREIEVYETYVGQYDLLTQNDERATYQVERWQNLADAEAKQSELFTELVAAQDEIISLLLEGNTAGSDSVVSVVQNANQTQETLSVTRTQAAAIRSELVSL